MPNDSDRYSCPDTLIQRIAELEAYGESWSLDAGEIRDLLGVSGEEFYRRIYAADRRDDPLVSLEAATGSYSQENIWEFVALVELFCGVETEGRLEQAGIFFRNTQQMEILGAFLSETAAALRLHRVASEQFSAMLWTFGSYERAREVYLREYFPLEELIDRAVSAYCVERTFAIPELARANVKRLLEFFFQKHVIEAGSIFAVLSDQLRRRAVAEGYAREDEGIRDERERAVGGISGASALLNAARRAMNLEGRSLSTALLKSQYKRLMKIYHPDINPQGLRRCQEITAAYSALLASL